MNHNRFGIIALISCYLFMSIMFPTIFALAIRGLGPQTKRGASFLVMAVAAKVTQAVIQNSKKKKEKAEQETVR